MPRLPPKQIEEGGKEVKEVEAQEPNIVEVEINLTLVNNKLNYIMSKLDQLTKAE